MKTCAVSAVKGGVGKSLLAVNIAKGLTETGNKVGLVDCDLDNANFSQMTGIVGNIEIKEKMFKPFDWNGTKVFSMSLIAGKEKGVSMTEDRYSQILDDVVQCTDWGVDYFILDLPSGSGSIFRSAMEIFSETSVGNIVVTQPSMLDASRRVLNLHKYLEIPVLGLIENMSYFKVNNKKYYPFGKSTVEVLAKEYGAEVLGKIPLSIEITKGIESGDPIIKGEGSEAIQKVVGKIVEAPVHKLSIGEKLKKVIDLRGIKVLTEKLLASFFIAIRKDFDLTKMREEKGFTEKHPLYLVITDESGTKEITRVALRIDEGGLKVIKNPKDVDFEIATDFHTLSRMIMGKKKVGKNEVPYDPMDAWLLNDVKVYGRGFTPRTIDVFRNVFQDEKLMADIKVRYENILGRWI